ncbi:MAG: valine--tRNA ligase [Armatimonadota bacterium]
MCDLPNIPKVYDPSASEAKWYKYWNESGCFKPRPARNGKGSYCITIPPPNVTGSLHIGHALCYTIHDVLLRWKRMQGFEVLCVPGTDHAGIATQNVVEKQLRAKGISRHDLGREAFQEEIWKWVEESGGTILNQFRRMGCSFEWDRTRFTMDEGYVKAIQQCFIDWWEAGHIYRGKRITNWCPRCLTAISDIEVEHVDAKGKLYHLRYPYADGSGYVVVATTRPETMLGDTAVAANPEDARYQPLFGAMVDLPLTGRQIPIIADEHARAEFGTGAVKITPAHDPNDFEVGLRHHLQQIVVIDQHGNMSPEAGEAYAGLSREEARKKILVDLEELGLLDHEEDYTVPQGTCARCHTVIEPSITEQWYVRMKELAQPAIDVVKEGKVRFIPDRFNRLYLEWMENIRDWCISRQLWWGHRIPVWYTEDGEAFAAITEEDALAKSGGRAVTQDNDVLDTWFSSGLWPQAVLGWPEPTDDLKRFYPTSVLITARDIIYLWVARMIMSGMHFMNEVPFNDVYIYATVLDEKGRRMSKSLGTGVDPLELVDTYGADALRYALLSRTATGQDLKFAAVQKGRHSQTEEARNFCNKIWNASRFVMMNLDDEFLAEYNGQLPAVEQRDVLDRWILSRLNQTAKTVNGALDGYNMDDAARAIYSFFWDDYCDWYIEMSKPRLNGDDLAQKRTVQTVLVYVLDQVLRLLHPFMPFVTEEIWQVIPHIGETIMYSDYPEFDANMDSADAEAKVGQAIEFVRTIRSLRSEIGLDISSKAPVYAVANGPEHASMLAEMLPVLNPLQRVQPVSLVPELPSDIKPIMDSCRLADIYMDLGQFDVSKEIARLQKEQANIENELTKLLARLNNPSFVERAPAEVVQKERENAAELQARIAKLAGRVTQLA